MSDITLSKAVRSNLLSLQNTADMMATTQNRLATGKKVNSALDNPTNFFTSSSLNSRAGDMNALLDGMANGIQTLEAADNGLKAITKTLESMQSTLRQARQDKSFNTESFDVTDKTTLNLSGGAKVDISSMALPENESGAKAGVTASLASYAGPTPAVAGAAGAGAGGRAQLTFDASLDGQSIKVDGKSVTAAGADAGTYATDLQSKLGTENYTVSEDNGTVIIEAKGSGSEVPQVELSGSGITQASGASTTIEYDASLMGQEFSAGGQTITAGSFEEFASALREKADAGGYTVSVDSDAETVTLTSTTTGAGSTAPAVTGLTSTAGSTTFTLDGTETALEIGGEDVTVAAAGDRGALLTQLQNDDRFAGRFTFSAGTNAQEVVVTSVATGEDSAPAIGGAAAASQTTNPGTGVNISTTAGTDGAEVENVEAVAHEISVTYGNTTADIEIGAGTEEEIAASINQQLSDAGIKGLTASFADNKLSITADNPEAKALSITGANVDDVFGNAKLTSKGEAATNATNATDRFVELLNSEYGTQVRASNDNGRLRIENLSTNNLSVTVDKDGDGEGAATTATIAGNSVRAGLADQFNELRDQLDKLADDASFNGVNLLRGDNLNITFNETGTSQIDIQTEGGKTINSDNLGIQTTVDAEDLDSDSKIDSFLNGIKTAINEVRSQSSSFGSNLSVVQNRQDFTKNMINTLETGAGNLTLADSNEEAANLLALQTRQQLSSTALSMASQQDQAVLRLF